MSRTKAKQTFSWDAAQRELVEPFARFEPRLVKMAPGSEPAEG